MCAGVGVGVYSDIQDAVDHIVNISEKTYYPSSIAHEEYMKYYELFKNAYISNKNILREIYNQWYYDARKNREIML
jgi:ribulose kinase